MIGMYVVLHLRGLFEAQYFKYQRRIYSWYGFFPFEFEDQNAIKSKFDKSFGWCKNIIKWFN